MLISLLLATTARGDDDPDLPETRAPGPLRQPVQLDDQVEQRLEWLEKRIDAEAKSATRWESLWSVVDVGGAGYGVYTISQQHSRGALAAGVVSVTKASLGVMAISVLPLHATLGARELAQRDRHKEDRVARLDFAEKVLYRNVVDANQCFSWKPHMLGLAVHLIGAVIIGALGDWKRAGESFGIGIAVTEAQIWTKPWRARKDLREYRETFGNVVPPAPPAKRVKLGASSLSVTF